MIHPHTRLDRVDDAVGFGVVATRHIPRGTVIWVRDTLDRRIPREEARKLGPLYRDSLRHFTFWEPDEDLILCWDHARYVNHSCQPNCLGGGFEFELAIRDIQEGEQLTNDYATFGYASAFSCRCGAPNCRGRVERRDSLSLADDWDALLRGTLPLIDQVEQPLAELIKDREQVARALADPEHLPRHWRGE